ncbi:transmembrane protein 68 isoform X1 [Pieris napi]|uniref:transmembrane protein 68 isoform X1 n=1 Tax=Pieris napi TaxID=78633 RepID=UPI001FBB8235|nr:transmembrane protein 68 isoform X1 [Pieris napi]
MVENHCDARPVKAYIMSDLLKKLDLEATNDVMKLAIAVIGFYVGSFYMEYVDTEYSLWLTWFLTPVIVTFLLPAVIIILIYLSSIIFYLYRLYRLRVVTEVQNDWKHAARVAVCALWDAHGWLWHGYEIRGVENIPAGPFLVIYYHGALPIDMYYFTARMLLFQRRHLHTVADRFLFKIPGWSQLLEGLCVIPGTVATCAGVLRSGNPLAISPGGVYEAQFGDHYYRLHWKSRTGFAKVALEANVPIIPMFTQNVREAFRTVGWLRGICLRIYAATRIPLAPVYGGFPVKLITHLGKPIYPDSSLTPEQLQQKVATAIEDLVEEHQRVPGSILHALIERVYEMPKKRPKKPYTNGTCKKDTAKKQDVSDKCDSDRCVNDKCDNDKVKVS